MPPAGTPGDEGTSGTQPPAFELTPEDVAAIIAAGQGPASQPEDPDKPRAERIYYEVWGRLPPKGWWKNVQHLSDFEIYDSLLGSQGVERTQYWRDKGAEVAATIARLMGRR